MDGGIYHRHQVNLWEYLVCFGICLALCSLLLRGPGVMKVYMVILGDETYATIIIHLAGDLFLHQ